MQNILLHFYFFMFTTHYNYLPRSLKQHFKERKKTEQKVKDNKKIHDSLYDFLLATMSVFKCLFILGKSLALLRETFLKAHQSQSELTHTFLHLLKTRHLYL